MKIWIGLVEPRILLVEDLERLLRAQGHDVTWRSYPTLPTGEALGRLVAMISARHDVFGWLCEETGPSAADLREQLESDRRHLFFQVSGDNVLLLGGTEPLGPAVPSPETSFQMARVFHGKGP